DRPRRWPGADFFFRNSTPTPVRFPLSQDSSPRAAARQRSRGSATWNTPGHQRYWMDNHISEVKPPGIEARRIKVESDHVRQGTTADHERQKSGGAHPASEINQPLS